MFGCKGVNSQMWSTCASILLIADAYNIQKTGNENIQAYQVEVVILLKHLILETNLQGNVKDLEVRINNQILGV